MLLRDKTDVLIYILADFQIVVKKLDYMMSQPCREVELPFGRALHG
jgi:hypothetical protein